MVSEYEYVNVNEELMNENPPSFSFLPPPPSCNNISPSPSLFLNNTTVQPGNVSTYQQVAMYSGGPVIALPYDRPCRSLCTAVTYLGPTCQGLMEVLGYPINCDAVDDAYSIPTFDSSSIGRSEVTAPQDGVCNDLGSTIGVQLVASPVEPYIGETCEGAIDVTITSTTIPGLHSLMPPYMLQTIIEGQLAAEVANVPRYFKSECLEAFSHYRCGVSFLGATSIDFLSFLYGGPVYIASFPETAVRQCFCVCMFVCM